MTRSLSVACLLAMFGFGILGGHWVWSTFGPPARPEYTLLPRAPWIQVPASQAMQAYFRREVRLRETPQHAWLIATATDHLTVTVNELEVDRRFVSSHTAGVIADVTHMLQAGENVLAIAVLQRTVGRPIRMACELVWYEGAQEHRIVSDESWRCHDVFERQAAYWFARGFDDRVWSTAVQAAPEEPAVIDHSPAVVTRPSWGRWVQPSGAGGSQYAIRSSFTLEGRPRQAWVRYAAAAPVRMLVNGVRVRTSEARLGVDKPTQPVQFAIDITPYLRRGANVIGALMTGAPESGPELYVEMEATLDQAVHRLATDAEWEAKALPVAPGWCEPGGAPHAAESGWVPVVVDAREATTARGDMRRWITADEPTVLFLLQRLAGWLAVITAVTLSVIVGCIAVGRRLGRIADVPWRTGVGAAASALVPATVVMGLILVASVVPRIATADFFTPFVLTCLFGSVVVIWLGLLAGAFFKARPLRTNLPHWVHRMLVLAAVLCSFGLRHHDLTREPLSPDEMRLLQCARGVLERGYPSFQVDPSLPLARGATSELVSYVQAPFVWLCGEDERYGLRLPSVLFETATTFLLFVVCRRYFNPATGVLAAWLHATAPRCLVMANFARYFSQLAFFTVLCCYFVLRMTDNPRRLPPRWIWASALAFLAMYFSWEGSALMGPGFALAVVWRCRFQPGALLSRHVAAACGTSLLLMMVQLSHRSLGQVEKLLYGTGATDATLMARWRLPDFEPFYYIWEASWTYYVLVPMVSLLVAGVLVFVPRWRRNITPLLLVLMTTGYLQAALLSLKAWRYSYALVPLLILVASASIVWFIGRFQRLAGTQSPWPWQGVAHANGALILVAVLLTGAYPLLQPAEESFFDAMGRKPWEPQFAEAQSCVAFIEPHLHADDVVIATTPQLVNAYLSRPCDYWLDTRLHLQATVNDTTSQRRHRISGTPMITDLEALAQIFQRHERIWFIANPEFNRISNHPDVVAFVRRHMDIQYQDFKSIVLFYSSNNRPAETSLEHDRLLLESGLNPLP